MTAEEYYALVSTYDERMIEQEMDRIPVYINRTGKLYTKLVKQIYEKYSKPPQACHSSRRRD